MRFVQSPRQLTQVPVISRQSKSVISHLTNAVRGIGDPLIAVYARTYLGRVGNNIIVVTAYQARSRGEHSRGAPPKVLC